jgi:hypothetical protein
MQCEVSVPTGVFSKLFVRIRTRGVSVDPESFYVYCHVMSISFHRSLVNITPFRCLPKHINIKLELEDAFSCNMTFSVGKGFLTLRRSSQKTFVLKKERHKPDDLNPQTHRYENFESRKTDLIILSVYLYGRKTSPTVLRDAVNS